MSIRLTTVLRSLFLLLNLNAWSLQAQKGAEDIYQDIEKFGVLANVLYVAAHPDDENTRLISYLSSHLHVNTTYLSMTRGDGGQNLIGPEIREMLGIIRSHELLEARKIDGGNQLFTRANDFGYSKTPDETFNIWDRKEVLSDVVWAIRKTKPDIIINRFSTDTSRPNHGHHTASAILSTEAFDLAADRTSYPEQLKWTQPWQPRRIFWNTSVWFYGSREAFDQADKSKMLAIDIGAFDQVSGQSNSEIAGRSRSMHKSQGFGAAETRGESLDYIDMLKDTEGTIPTSLFDGIDITWNRIPGGSKIATMAKQLEENYDFRAPKKSVPLLLDIRKSILQLPDSFWKTKKLAECDELIKNCLGLFVELRTTQFRITPGLSLPVTLEAINRSDVDVNLTSLSPAHMDTVFTLNTPLLYNQDVTVSLRLSVPDQLTIPYWIQEPPTEGMYVVPDQQKRGIPGIDPALMAEVGLEIQGQLIRYRLPVIYKTVDPAEGEVTKPVYITPPVTAEVESEALVFNQGEARMIPVRLTAMADSVSGTLDLRMDDPAWKVTSASVDFIFHKAGETKTINCLITPPAKPSHTVLHPEVVINGTHYQHKISTIDYDHLPYLDIIRDASTPLQSLDIKITQRPIAYINGAGDDVAASLRQIGYKVDVIDPELISPDLLEHYQVVILGVRAFNTVDALAYKNSILFDWVEKGGTMIVQYNVSRGLVTEQIAPYPLTLSRDRVTEENTPVKILSAEHPALQSPNPIKSADFAGWVQERGLYFPNKWDEHFTPLFQMHDAGENPLDGAVLVAPYGAGYYVYSGLSWFRHLPAGIPGSYRLLSNLISLGYKNNKS